MGSVDLLGHKESVMTVAGVEIGPIKDANGALWRLWERSGGFKLVS